MNGHGGARPGSGAKAKLSRRQCLAIGAEYERLWQDLGRDAAFRRYQARKKVQAVRELQEAIASIDIKRRRQRVVKQFLEDTSDDIAAKLSKPQRPIRIKRPWGKSEWVAHQVIAWCKAKYGIPITVRMVETCKKALRRLERRNQVS
jgi:hypothetical protein